ncbi:hypothetical protein FRC17_010277 [Serendipita sp. 399]|nr:hypothetical protein FRC17_010277 [Serendipita sp. 399]
MKFLRSLQQPQHNTTTNNTNHGLGITVNDGQTQALSKMVATTTGLRRSGIAGPSNTEANTFLGYRIAGLAETESGAHLVSSSASTSFPPVNGPLHYVPAPVTIYRSLPKPPANSAPPIDRQPTLFTKNASPERKMAELQNVLGKERSGRLPSKAKVLSSQLDGRRRSISAAASPVIALEQAKSCPRVEIDLLLDSGTCVESGYLKGKVLVNIRPPTRKEGPLYLGGGKIRVVGFEAIPFNDLRHTFYHCGAPLDKVSPFTSSLYTSEPDIEGLYRAQEGNHVIPFAMRLPPRDTHQPVAKGSYNSRTNGSSIRYIAMVSIRLKDAVSSKKSIAHFYRTIEVWPLFDPTVILSPSPSPVYATVAKNLFLGGEGTLKLTASIHRSTWIAGARCYVKIFIDNDTEKRNVHTLTLSLIRSETIFKPVRPTSAVPTTPGKDAEVIDNVHQTSTIRRVVARTSLGMGDKAVSRHSTAKGWWTGVDAGSSMEFNHYIILPPFALTISPGRLIEVDYTLDVGVDTGPFASEISVSLPIRIINSISVDPPPIFGLPERLGNIGTKGMEVVRSGTQAGISLDYATPKPIISQKEAVPFPTPPILPYVQLDDNGTYRGSVGMPRIGILRVQNCVSNDTMSSGSRGFSTQGPWIQERAIETGLQPALQESDEGLVEPGRPQSQIRMSHLLETSEPTGKSHMPSESVHPSGHEPMQPLVGFMELGRAILSSDQISSCDSSEHVDMVLRAVESDKEPDDEVSVDQIGYPAPVPELMDVEPKVEVMVADIGDRLTKPTSPTALVESNADLIAPSDPVWVSDFEGTSALAATSPQAAPSISPNASASTENKTPQRRPLPSRPRPHPIFMSKGRFPGPKGTTLRQSVDLSTGELKAGPRPQLLGRTSLQYQSEMPHKQSAAIRHHSEQSATKGRPDALQVGHDADQKVTSPLIDIPASVSALMRQNLKTPMLTLQQSDQLEDDDSQSSGQVSNPSKSTINKPGLTKKVDSSIQSRIAMFERNHRGSEVGGSLLMWTGNNHAPRPSRTGAGDPFRSKRL